MFRPPGFGNLQGFIGYSTALLGIPTDLLLGFQNDGETADIIGDDREHPFLQIQPKINFDLDFTKEQQQQPGGGGGGMMG
jgi:hypothetical protein